MKKNAQYLEQIYDNNAPHNSVFEPYYADAHKIIWKEKYEDFLKSNDATKTKRINQINACVHDLLVLMCSRFELTDVRELDSFFKSSAEYRGDFLKHAHHVIMYLGMQKTIKKHPEKQKQYTGVLLSQTHKNNKSLEEEPLIFSLGEKQWSEKQVYAIASIYAIELALISYEELDMASSTNLQSDLYKLLSGPEYSDIIGIKGAHKKHHKNRAIKKRAEDIYIEKKLLGQKNFYAATAIYEALQKEGTKDISVSTIETKWVPEFIKKLKDLK